MSVLGLIFFNIFIPDLEEDVEQMHIEFVEDLKPDGKQVTFRMILTAWKNELKTIDWHLAEITEDFFIWETEMHTVKAGDICFGNIFEKKKLELYVAQKSPKKHQQK